MKLAILVLMCMGTAYVQGDCGDSDFAKYCWDDPYMAEIVCDATSCACNIYGALPVADACADITAAVMGDLTLALLTGEKCEEICEASKLDSTDKCEFFRWETVGSTHSHCTLMNAEQCKEYKSCQRGQCKSGQAGCDGGVVPDTVKCDANVPFNPLPTAVHWQCIYPDTNSIEHVNIYGPDQVPTGVHCWTAHKCKAFDDGTPEDDPNDVLNANTLHVQCNPNKVADGSETWGKFPGELTNDVTAYIELGKLIDPVCDEKPGQLTLDAKILHEPGVSFICDNELVYTDANVIVNAPNTCILLCNFHHAFTIENELDEQGNGVWNKYDAGSDVPEEVVEANVKCWDFMKL